MHTQRLGSSVSSSVKRDLFLFQEGGRYRLELRRTGVTGNLVARFRLALPSMVKVSMGYAIDYRTLPVRIYELNDPSNLRRVFYLSIGFKNESQGLAWMSEVKGKLDNVFSGYIYVFGRLDPVNLKSRGLSFRGQPIR